MHLDRPQPQRLEYCTLYLGHHCWVYWRLLHELWSLQHPHCSYVLKLSQSKPRILFGIGSFGNANAVLHQPQVFIMIPTIIYCISAHGQADALGHLREEVIAFLFGIG